MLFDFLTCGLTWAESLYALLPFLTVALFKFINDKFSTVIAITNGANNSKSDTTANIAPITTTTTAATLLSPEKQNQKSEECETSSKRSSLPLLNNSSPPLTSRHSFSLIGNAILKPAQNIPSPPDTLFTDEYHEDEDTLSLENLFPCDQSEIYASKKISFIIDELIQTEANYVNNLRKGLNNYGRLHEREDLPESMREKQQLLLGNIDEIARLHEEQILPMMLRNQRDLKQLFDDFAVYFDKNQLYAYAMFTMNKKKSMQLRQDHREWLQQLQTEIKDKLGIDSFLVQPIQRLTRYPLLLQQFISEFYKSGISCKPVLASVCKLETRMRRLLEVVNQAEEIPAIEELGDLNLCEQGYFRKSTEFDVFHHRSRKKYRAKIFLFDRCLVCVEVRKRRLAFRQSYDWTTIDVQLGNAKTISMLMKGSSGLKEELELCSPESISITQWLRLARKISESARLEAAQEGVFSLPMDLVLGMAFAVWFIWLYL